MARGLHGFTLIMKKIRLDGSGSVLSSLCPEFIEGLSVSACLRAIGRQADVFC